MNKQSRFEVIRRGRKSRKYKSRDEFMEDYRPHIEYGAGGTYNEDTGAGEIFSHMKACRRLEREGYKNLHFGNGGDDDILVVDHHAKEFGFFEDYAPNLSQVPKSKTLTQLWEAH